MAVTTTGGIRILDLPFVNGVTMSSGRAVIFGATDKSIILPTGDNPAFGSGVLVGISREGDGTSANSAAGQSTSVRVIGSELVKAGGTVTAGQFVCVLNTGTVKNIVNNGGSPALQSCLGYAFTSGASGDMVEVFVMPQYISY